MSEIIADAWFREMFKTHEKNKLEETEKYLDSPEGKAKSDKMLKNILSRVDEIRKQREG